MKTLFEHHGKDYLSISQEIRLLFPNLRYNHVKIKNVLICCFMVVRWKDFHWYDLEKSFNIGWDTVHSQVQQIIRDRGEEVRNNEEIEIGIESELIVFINDLYHQGQRYIDTSLRLSREMLRLVTNQSYKSYSRYYAMTI